MVLSDAKVQWRQKNEGLGMSVPVVHMTNCLYLQILESFDQIKNDLPKWNGYVQKGTTIQILVCAVHKDL